MGRESCTPAICAGWTGGAIAALGIGAAILSGAGAAAADTGSGTGSGSAPSAHSAQRDSTPAKGRSARPAKAPAGSSKSAVKSPVVTSSSVTTTRGATATSPASTTEKALAAPKSPAPNPMAVLTAAVNSFFKQMQTSLSAAAARTATPPRTGPSTWGAPSRTVNFTDASVLSQFVVYTGTFPEGNRTPDALSFSNGTMTITGDAQGNDEGIAWTPGQKYGGWEVRLRVPAGAANYDPVLLLWPDAENWPRGGEIDFMEMWNDPQRQTVNSVLHYSQSNKQVGASMAVDATQWHTYAVKWTSTQITTYVDGVPLFTTTNKSTFPPGAMHLCIQLDTMGPDIAAGASMEVAWAKQYSLAAVT